MKHQIFSRYDSDRVIFECDVPDDTPSGRRTGGGMKAIKTIAACTILVCATAASAQDRWSGDNKPKHIAASAISAVVVESLFEQTLHPVERFGLAMLPGVAKELYDMRRGGSGSGFSGKDIAADALGVLGGMAFYGLVIRPNFVGINVKF